MSDEEGVMPFEETYQVSLGAGNTGRRQRGSGYLVVPVPRRDPDIEPGVTDL